MSVNYVEFIMESGTKLSLVDNNKNNVYYFSNKNDIKFSINDDLQVSHLLHEQYISSLKIAISYRKINGECVYNQSGELFCIQIKNKRNMVSKIYFVSKDEKSLISVNDYNPKTGKIVRTILYREKELTVSSIKEYDYDTSRPICSTFYKEDGRTISSLFEYSNFSDEIKYTLFCDDGEMITEYV